jgi:SAM-dependent methyltransferase
MQSHFIISGTRFPLVDKPIPLAGATVNLATVPYSPAELDRIVGLVGLKERAWPYWLEDWPATYALAAILDGEEPSAWPGPVLDLGCGSGVLAAYLRLRFGIVPFSCDFNSDACRLAARNVMRNAPAGQVDGAHGASPMARFDASRVFCADFRAFPAKASFGLVLGGEMLYAAENQAPILGFLERHLARGGAALFADPGRSAAEGFAESARALGFRVETRELPVRAGDWKEARDVRVYRLIRDR